MRTLKTLALSLVLLALAAAPLAAQTTPAAPTCSPDEAFLDSLATPEVGPAKPAATLAGCSVYFCQEQERLCLAGCPCGFVECNAAKCESYCVCPFWCPPES